MNLGPTELIVILVIALIVFGPRKLPDLGKTIGQAMAQFRRASDDFKRSWEQEVESEKSRLNSIKDEIGDLGQDTNFAGSDFNYSMDPDRGESDVATTETGTEVETGAETAADKAEITPQPAPATIARSSETSQPEHWI